MNESDKSGKPEPAGIAEQREAWSKKTARDAFRTKTPFAEAPIRIGHGSSTHYPGKKGGVTTSDIVLWVYFWDTWFRPYGGFDSTQIKSMYELCHNDNQVQALFEMLSCKPI